MTPTHFPWLFTLKNEVLSFRGKEGQLMFEQPLSAVEEAWWEAPRVLNLHVWSEHYSLCFVSSKFLQTANHSGNGCLNLIFLVRGMRRVGTWEAQTHAEIAKWCKTFPKK